MDREVLAAIEQGDNLEIGLAYALLLVDLASIDARFADEEYSLITGMLQRNFKLTPEEAAQTIAEAKTMQHPFRGALGYADQLKRDLSQADRERLMQLLDDVMNSDNVRDNMELYLRGRYSALLGLGPAGAKAD
jgi:uncharacterized tellurite resistance protein B-like protein